MKMAIACCFSGVVGVLVEIEDKRWFAMGFLNMLGKTVNTDYPLLVI
jgi:hypothetical protein